MPEMNLKNGDPIAILNLGGDLFIQKVVSPQAPFVAKPVNVVVVPTVELYEMTADESVQVSMVRRIEDANQVEYPLSVGPRPRNIKKR
jgi:hypothetical protein